MLAIERSCSSSGQSTVQTKKKRLGFKSSIPSVPRGKFLLHLGNIEAHVGLDHSRFATERVKKTGGKEERLVREI